MRIMFSKTQHNPFKHYATSAKSPVKTNYRIKLLIQNQNFYAKLNFTPFVFVLCGKYPAKSNISSKYKMEIIQAKNIIIKIGIMLYRKI